jgi:hypothetical protein
MQPTVEQLIAVIMTQNEFITRLETELADTKLELQHSRASYIKLEVMCREQCKADELQALTADS